jgi:hypothetical protein
MARLANILKLKVSQFVFGRQYNHVLHQNAAQAVRNKDDWSPFTGCSGVTDSLQHSLSMLVDRHPGCLAFIPMTRARVIAVSHYANIVKVASKEVERPIARSFDSSIGFVHMVFRLRAAIGVATMEHAREKTFLFTISWAILPGFARMSTQSMNEANIGNYL